VEPSSSINWILKICLTFIQLVAKQELVIEHGFVFDILGLMIGHITFIFIFEIPINWSFASKFYIEAYKVRFL
jgi:hypothetical protein